MFDFSEFCLDYLLQQFQQPYFPMSPVFINLGFCYEIVFTEVWFGSLLRNSVLTLNHPKAIVECHLIALINRLARHLVNQVALIFKAMLK